MLRPLQDKFKPEAFPNLLVGLGQPDDAAVYRISDDVAIVQTVDFFTPIVDDAYAFGAIAAANAMSDIYAMGGEVLFALNLCAFPEDLPGEIISDILRGGADKVFEAGAAIAGGHSIKDKEPKYGLSVTGKIHPSQLMAKGGARPGDALVLTKPLGTGVITTALKQDKSEAAHVAAAIASMSRLNKEAGHAAQAFKSRGATDITGFGLLGHSIEMANQAHVQFQFDWDKLAFLPGTLHYGAEYIFPGGAITNQNAYQDQVVFAGEWSEWQKLLLFDPQTSGGLLIAVGADEAERLVQVLRAQDVAATRVGRVADGDGIVVTL